MGVAQNNFEYEVGFSFLQEDEHAATQLNDLLQDRYSTFLYSERQKVIAGTDGEEAFNRAFGEECRCVVVFHREAWGSTPWTRIEQTAIRNRAHDHGYDFALFVPMDGRSLPGWVPKNRIYLNWDRWGVKGVAAVVDARIQELGGVSSPASLESTAARMDRQRQYDQKRKRALDSGEGVTAFKQLKQALFDALGDAIGRVNKAQAGIVLTAYPFPDRGVIHIEGLSRNMTVDGAPHYVNTTEGGSLKATIWESSPPKPGYMSFERPQISKQLELMLGFNHGEQYVWEAGDRELTSTQLADYLLDWYLNYAGKVTVGSRVRFI